MSTLAQILSGQAGADTTPSVTLSKLQGPTVKIPTLAGQLAAKNIAASRSLAWFVPGGHVSQLPHAGHVALDIGAAQGSPVYNPVSGIVTAIEKLTGRPSFGYNVRIRVANGLEEVFAHLSEIGVNVGETVAAGQAIGAVGATGTTASHLHYEVRNPGRDIFKGSWSTTSARDPVSFLQSLGRSAAALVGVSSPAGSTAAAAAAAKASESKALAAQRVAEAKAATATAAPAKTSTAAAPAKTSTGKQAVPTTAAAKAPAAAADSGERTLLKTPLGDVKLPAIHWWNVGGFVLGSAIVVIAFAQLAKGGIERGAREIGKLEKLQGQAAMIAAKVATVA